MVELPDSDEQIEICSMNAAGYVALAEAQRKHEGNQAYQTVVILKYCVPAFSERSMDEILDVLDMSDALFLSKEIMELSGLGDDLGNSDSDQSSVSSTG